MMNQRFFLFVAMSAGWWIGCGNNAVTNENGVGKDTVAVENNTTVTATTTTFSNTPKGVPTKITGKVQGAVSGMRVFLDRKMADNYDILGSANIHEDGTFELNAGIEQPAIFRLRIDASPVGLILQGGETVAVNATLVESKVTTCLIEGSPASQELNDWSRKSEKEIADYLGKASEDKALLNYALVEKLNITDHFALYAKVRDHLAAKAANSPYATPLNVRVMQEEMRLNTPNVDIGAIAPDIRLKSPDGKEYSLSELKGKVVLLDFWASWCGPCRRENPNVVRTYKAYQSKGFEVFSVSLDGLDDHTMTRIGSPQQVEQAMESERKKWKDAIDKDGLVWKYHVSELRRWSSQVAQLYQVNSIPRAFLIDRKGKIRYMNLRGAELEMRVKELL